DRNQRRQDIGWPMVDRVHCRRSDMHTHTRLGLAIAMTLMLAACGQADRGATPAEDPAASAAPSDAATAATATPPAGGPVPTGAVQGTAPTATAADPADAAAGSDTLRATAAALFGTIPGRVEELRGQPLSSGQVELGHMLFFDPRLSRSQLITCNTCHSIGTGGADNVPVSIGHGWQRGPRNSPTVFNAVFNAAQFWDGRAADLAEQAKGPVQASVEMNSTPDLVVRTLQSLPEYVGRVGRAFPGRADPVSCDNMALVLEAVEASLITPVGRFDLWLLGDVAAMDAEERRGLELFVSSGCGSCHNGRNFGGQAYFP